MWGLVPPQAGQHREVMTGVNKETEISRNNPPICPFIPWTFEERRLSYLMRLRKKVTKVLKFNGVKKIIPQSCTYIGRYIPADNSKPHLLKKLFAVKSKQKKHFPLKNCLRF